MQAAQQTYEIVQLSRRLHDQLFITQDAPDPINLLHLHSPSARYSHHKQLKIYQHKLDIVSSVFAELSANLSVIGRNINTLRANMHGSAMPIYSLPNEILYLIFEMVCFSDPPITARDIAAETRPHLQKSWITLSSICTQWRDIVRESNPSLCSQLSFNSDDSLSALSLKTLFHASRDHPLHLRLYKRNPQTRVFPAAITQRIRSLTVDFPTSYTRFFRQAVNPEHLDLSSRFPHLESLRIVNSRTHPEDLPGSVHDDLLSLPSLSSLSLENCLDLPEWLLAPHACGGKLKEITLKMVKFADAGQLDMLLANHTYLEKLRLEEVCYAPRALILSPTLGLHGASGIPPDNGGVPQPGSGAPIQLGNLRVLEVINCSVRFTRDVILNQSNLNNGHHGHDAAESVSPFRNLTHLSLDFGYSQWSHAELTDRFDKYEENEIEFAVDNLGIDRLFGEDLSWRETTWKDWGYWRACNGIFDAFLDGMNKLESVELCGSPALVAHVIDALQQSATPITSPSLSSLTQPLVSIRCPQLQEMKVQFPTTHKTYSPEQIEPLRRTLCTFLDRSLLPIPIPTPKPIVAATQTNREPRRFKRLSIPMCFSKHFGMLEPRTRNNLAGATGNDSDVDDSSTPAWARNYIVERLQSCIYGRLCSS